MSKVFEMARKWDFYSGEQSREWGVAPRKKAGPRKARLHAEQILRLLSLLKEPVRTMVLLGILDRHANRGDSGIAPKGCRISLPARSGSSKLVIAACSAPPRPKAADALFPCQGHS